MRYRDWGERSHRWAGIRSEGTVVNGVSVHCLRADAAPEAPAGAAHQLLIHPMGAGATWWLDVIRPLTAYGPVIAPDLPGSLVGDTGPTAPRDARAANNARFLHGFVNALALNRTVVHGWSMGGLVATLYAAAHPEQTPAMVLTAPTLPPVISRRQAFGWNTLGRAALATVPPLARGILRVAGRRLIDRKIRTFHRAVSAGRLEVAGGDLSRLTPETAALLEEGLAEVRGRPERLRTAVFAFASVVSAMYVQRKPVEQAIETAPPALVLCGDHDPVVDRAAADGLHRRRPDWTTEVVEGVGHLLPMEAPGTYVDRVGRWLEGLRHQA